MTQSSADHTVARRDGKRRPRATDYLAALASVAAVAYAQHEMAEFLEDPSHFTLLLVAVCFSSWLGGLGPGLVALAASCVVGSFFFAAPKLSIRFEDRGDAVSLFLYFVVGATILYFGERHRRDRQRLEVREAEVRSANDRLHDLNESLEARVAERTAELRASNDLLETFSYSVAHDLRSSLIAIVANAGILKQDHSETLDKEAKGLVDRTLDGCRRLSSVLDGLLMHARLGQRPVSPVSIDLTAMANEEAERLSQMSWPADSLEFRIQPGMVVHGDRALVSIVLHNLLENACKFSCPGKPQVVEVTQEFSGERAVTVRDAGLGFDAQFVGKLFRPFERLHTGFPGVGMGLANAARIVERHGGRISADGTEGIGASFSFVLPEAALRDTAVVLFPTRDVQSAQSIRK